jgi:hypothetical protein
MTMTVLGLAPGTGDAGQVAAEQRCADPEVPERARRRTFAAQYKLDIVAEYDVVPSARRARACAGRPAM